MQIYSIAPHKYGFSGHKKMTSTISFWKCLVSKQAHWALGVLYAVYAVQYSTVKRIIGVSHIYI